MAELLKKAEQGNAGAQYALGECYYYGTGVPRNEAEAIKWLQKAAQQGHAKAQSLLDRCLSSPPQNQGHSTAPIQNASSQERTKARNISDGFHNLAKGSRPSGAGSGEVRRNRPTPEQFGLTDKEVELKEREMNDWENYGFKIGIVSACTLNFLLVLSYFGIVPAIISIITGFFWGLLPGMLLSRILPVLFVDSSGQFRKFKSAIEKYEYWLTRTRQEHWVKLRGLEFEHELAELFAQHGYDVVVTPPSGDDGIDLIMRKNGKVTIVQCKAHSRQVGPGAARELYGTLMSRHADEAILASVSGFSEGVRSFVSGKGIRLLSVNDIIEMEKELKY